jgi:TRAP-type C4-dicarboxylate transport system permease large subunit
MGSVGGCLCSFLLMVVWYMCRWRYGRNEHEHKGGNSSVGMALAAIRPFLTVTFEKISLLKKGR